MSEVLSGCAVRAAIQRTNDPATLTISHAQYKQPWVLPLAQVHESGAYRYVWGSHAVLHAAKSVGKLASVFEALDHSGRPMTEEQRNEIAAMAADLMTIAMRFANLYKFDIAAVLCERVAEKNGMRIPAWE